MRRRAELDAPFTEAQFLRAAFVHLRIAADLLNEAGRFPEFADVIRHAADDMDAALQFDEGRS